MYLKNTSNTVLVIINTARGRVSIKPQEIVDIKYKILPPISRSIVQVTEKDYLAFFEQKKSEISAVTNIKEEDLVKDRVNISSKGEDGKEESLDDLDRIDDEIEQPLSKVEADVVSDLIEVTETKVAVAVDEEEVNDGKVVEVKEEEEKNENEALVVTETNSDDEIAVLNKQIEELRKAWAATSAVRKKEQLSKKIKELQKQLKKINSKK